MPDNASKSISYMGSSMNPTLKAPDRLQVVPCRAEEIQSGDVIVFLPPGSDHLVVHRVIFVDSRGIKTRGDHNTDIDPWVLSPEHIVGRVAWANWGNKQRSICGGLRGRLYSLGIRAINLVDSRLSSLLHPIYHWLARTGALRRWLPLRGQTRVLYFDRPCGRELQLLIGRRVIGRLLSGRNEWLIRRPFRLFVNEASLPRVDSDHSVSSESRPCR